MAVFIVLLMLTCSKSRFPRPRRREKMYGLSLLKIPERVSGLSERLLQSASASTSFVGVSSRRLTTFLDFGSSVH